MVRIRFKQWNEIVLFFQRAVHDSQQRPLQVALDTKLSRMAIKHDDLRPKYQDCRFWLNRCLRLEQLLG